MDPVPPVTNNDEQQFQFQVDQASPEWSQSEYKGPSQLPMAVVSISCGIVIVLLIGYIMYLQRALWEGMVAEGKKQMRRMTMRTPFSLLNDPLAQRLDALEKALRGEVTAVNAPLPKVESYDSTCKYSIHTGESSSTSYSNRPRAVSFAGATSAIPESTTMQGSIASDKSFYSQPGNSFTLSASPLPTIQIHSAESVSLSVSASFDTQNRPRSVSMPPPMLPVSQPKRYGQLGEPRHASTAPTLLLPQAHQPSLSSMLHEFTLDSDEESEEADVPKSRPSRLLIPPGLHGDDGLSDESPSNSSLNTPALSPTTPSSARPSSPLLTPSFDMFNSRLKNIRSSIHSQEAIRTLDDIHEDIKRSYGAFLCMVEEGLFDSPQNSPHIGHLRTSLYDSSADAITIAKDTSTGWTSAQDGDGDMTEESSNEFNKRFISMLIQDLQYRTSKVMEDITVRESYFSVEEMTIPPRAQNPVTAQLEEGGLPVPRNGVDALGLGWGERRIVSPANDWPESPAGPRPGSYTTSAASPKFEAPSSQTPRQPNVFQLSTASSPNTPNDNDNAFNRHSMIVSRPVRGDLHLRNYEFDGRVDTGVFGFGRALKASSSPDVSHSSGSCYSPCLEESVGEETIPRGSSSRMEKSRSLPNTKKERRTSARVWAALPPTPALPPEIEYTLRS